jgi:hypothetical protein
LEKEKKEGEALTSLLELLAPQRGWLQVVGSEI